MLLDPYVSPGTIDPRDTEHRQAWADHHDEREDLVEYTANQLIEEAGRRGPLNTWGAAEICRFVLHVALDEPEGVLP